MPKRYGKIFVVVDDDGDDDDTIVIIITIIIVIVLDIIIIIIIMAMAIARTMSKFLNRKWYQRALEKTPADAVIHGAVVCRPACVAWC